ncbi:MAG TPA: hypothetical protein DCM40_09960, partial [Maribacter sp.]|nr:hypothetical protein [Maribacter sp.]
IKYKGDTIQVPDDFIIKCGQHAESRGMTLEEYIIEAFTKLEEQQSTAADDAANVMSKYDPLDDDSMQGC